MESINSLSEPLRQPLRGPAHAPLAPPGLPRLHRRPDRRHGGDPAGDGVRHGVRPPTRDGDRGRCGRRTRRRTLWRVEVPGLWTDRRLHPRHPRHHPAVSWRRLPHLVWHRCRHHPDVPRPRAGGPHRGHGAERDRGRLHGRHRDRDRGVATGTGVRAQGLTRNTAWSTRCRGSSGTPTR